MTVNGFAGLVMVGAALALSACATPEDLAPAGPAAPPSTAPQIAPPRPAYTPPQAPATQGPKPTTQAATLKSTKHQYLDQRTGKYYYFDQTTHRYYWEDGTPRY